MTVGLEFMLDLLLRALTMLKERGEACEVCDEVLPRLPLAPERGADPYNKRAFSLLACLNSALVSAGEHAHAEPLMRSHLTWRAHRLWWANITALAAAGHLTVALESLGRAREAYEVCRDVQDNFVRAPEVPHTLAVSVGSSLLARMVEASTTPTAEHSTVLCEQLHHMQAGRVRHGSWNGCWEADAHIHKGRMEYFYGACITDCIIKILLRLELFDKAVEIGSEALVQQESELADYSG